MGIQSAYDIDRCGRRTHRVRLRTLNGAARRRGIVLQWIYAPESAEAALRSGHVDLWPVMTITPERTRVLHFSAPFLESALSMLVRSDNPARQLSDLAGARVDTRGCPSIARLLARYVPHARPVAMPAQDLLKSVCAGDLDAAFMVANATINVLLEGRYLRGPFRARRFRRPAVLS
ncbi:MAG: transporter substrate-binding domain-containing protein [Ignavibacteriota bacterium]